MREAKQILKMTRRSVRSNTGRYLALLLIVLLSVGFFSGLKVTKPAMQSVLKTYLDRQKLYDFRLLSRTGFPEADAAALNNLDGIEDAEGAVSADVMAEKYVLHVQSLQDSVNLPSLTDGRMPEKATECLADRRLFGQEDIGRRLDIDTGEFGQAAGMLCVDHVTIVGLCDSPAFISTDRGTASVGSGSPDGFILVPKNAFIHIIFTEIDLTVQESAPVYSDRYDELIDDMRHKIEDLLDDRSMSAYILTRRENPGYRSFENDTAIVSGIANIFPVFFILIGMLVCVTTMTRMVEENRTETGTLKALGYSSFAVSAGYLIYAGSAALLGWAAGYFAGTWGLPQIFWLAYSSVYGFAPLPYLFDPALALITLLAAEAGILLSTYFATRTILAGQPAQLIRPRTAKSGKRILIERITPLWKRLSFLSKITLRNMFRYKQRLIMMLTGISCCAGLVLTGFGVRDSLIPVTHLQYDRVQKYQIEASAESGKIRKAAEKAAMTLRGEYTDGTTGAGRVQRETGTDAVQPAGGAGTASETETAELIMPCSLSRVTLKTDGRSMDGASMYAAEDGTAFAAFWNLGENHFPGEGETVVCTKIAQQLGLRPGDTLTIEDPDMNKVQVKVSGIFENYIGSVLIVAADTLSQQTGDYEPDTLLIRTGTIPPPALKLRRGAANTTGCGKSTESAA